MTPDDRALYRERVRAATVRETDNLTTPETGGRPFAFLIPSASVGLWWYRKWRREQEAGRC